MKKNQSTFRRNRFIFLTSLAVVTLSGALCVQPSLAVERFGGWTGPTTNPPSGFTTSLLNGSNGLQKKLGSLLIGDAGFTPTSKLCLNPDITNLYDGVADPVNCISRWSDLFSGGGSYVRNLPGTQASTDYDSGYTYFQAEPGYQQYHTLLLDANSATTNSSAVYGWAASDTDYAGWFNGKVAVGRTTAESRICLNDEQGGGGRCISSWEDATTIPGDAIRLQQTGALTADSGNFMISGPVVLSSSDPSNAALIVGEPPMDAALMCTSPSCRTCGDGLCSTNIGETLTTCPIDCQ